MQKEWEELVQKRQELQKQLVETQKAANQFPYLQEDLERSRLYHEFPQFIDSLNKRANKAVEKISASMINTLGPEKYLRVIAQAKIDGTPEKLRSLKWPDAVDRLLTLTEPSINYELSGDVKIFKEIIGLMILCSKFAMPEVKSELKDELRTREQERKDLFKSTQLNLQSHLNQELEWGTSDLLHLEFFLKQVPSRKSSALHLFKKKFPEIPIDHLALPIPNVSYTPTSRPLETRHRSKRKNHQPSVVSQKIEPAKRPWRFIFINESTATEHEISSQIGEAEHQLANLLALQPHLQSVTAKYVLARIIQISQSGLQERQRKKQVAFADLEGWKIIRLSHFRIFLDIKEKDQIIRFLIRPRSDAYK